MRAEEALEKKAAEARKKQDAKLSTVQTMVDGYERDESETGSSKTEVSSAMDFGGKKERESSTDCSCHSTSFLSRLHHSLDQGRHYSSDQS